MSHGKRKTLILGAIEVSLSPTGRIQLAAFTWGHHILETRPAKAEVLGVTCQWLMRGARKGASVRVQNVDTGERWLLSCRPVKHRGKKRTPAS
jgi:hypothetical protein